MSVIFLKPSHSTSTHNGYLIFFLPSNFYNKDYSQIKKKICFQNISSYFSGKKIKCKNIRSNMNYDVVIKF